MSGFWRLAGVLVLATLIGAPLIAVLWETLNQLFAGIVRPRQLAFAVPTLFIAVVLLRVLARIVARLDPRTAESASAPPPTR